MVEPAVILDQEEIQESEFIHFVEVVNEQQQTIPDINPEQITLVKKVESTSKKTYNIEVKTSEGKEVYIVTQDNKGDVQVIDYQPVTPSVIKLPNVVKPIHTELTVDLLTGVETKVTNDTKVIAESVEIQTVLTELEKIQIVDR